MTNLNQLSDIELRKDHLEARAECLACVKLLQCGGGVTSRQIIALQSRANGNLCVMQIIEQEQQRRTE